MPTKTRRAREGGLSSERGAALITVVLMATLLLAAGMALVTVTSTSAVNAADATSESQAYYAAEAGAQEVLSVLRGQKAPDTLFNATLADAANKITFRKAVTVASSNAPGDAATFARLSRWLSYNGTSAAARVPLHAGYTPASGMAFSVEEVADPDNSTLIAFSTSGAFSDGSTSRTVDGATLTYTAHAASTVNTVTSGASDFGSFTLSASSNGNHTWTNEPFTLTVTQTAPWAATKNIACTITGTIQKTGSNYVGALVITYPALTYSLDDVDYALSATTSTVINTSAVSIPVTVTAPEPQRLRVKVVGYGPRNAVKKMQMLISSSAFDYNAAGAITLRSNDNNTTPMNFAAGDSSVFTYDGNDNAHGPDLPAFSVTGDQDVSLINALPSNQVTGTPRVRQVPITSLDLFLRTTTGPRGARAAVETLKLAAKNQRTPGCTSTDPNVCDRYFAAGETPTTLGAGTDGLTTFVDGDFVIPPGGGAGLLVVTGTLTMQGSADFKGLILVLGGGRVIRNGGGGDTSFGAMAVARFTATSNFLEPTFQVSGGGNSGITYDSDWVRKALKSTGPGVLGISEYGP